MSFKLISNANGNSLIEYLVEDEKIKNTRKWANSRKVIGFIFIRGTRRWQNQRSPAKSAESRDLNNFMLPRMVTGCLTKINYHWQKLVQICAAFQSSSRKYKKNNSHRISGARSKIRIKFVINQDFITEY